MGYKLNEDMFNLTSIEGNENQNHDLSFHIHHVCMYVFTYVYTHKYMQVAILGSLQETISPV